MTTRRKRRKRKHTTGISGVLLRLLCRVGEVSPLRDSSVESEGKPGQRLSVTSDLLMRSDKAAAKAREVSEEFCKFICGISRLVDTTWFHRL